MDKHEGNLLFSNYENHLFKFSLYSSDKLTDYLIIYVYLRRESINHSFPFYNDTGHIAFDIYKNDFLLDQIRDYSYEPHVF